MTASQFQELGLTLSLFKPTISGATYTPAGTPVGVVTNQVEEYSHTIQAMGGYWTASFTINGSQEDVEDWIANGLGRHLEVKDDSLVTVWEGFVNQVSASIGPLSLVRGPLTDIANRVSLVYSTVDTSTTPPTIGIRERTDAVTDADSQGRYGIFEKVLSSGGVTAGEADEIRNQYLEERKEPKTTQTISFGEGSPPSVTVVCLGYSHFLRQYVYNDDATSALQNLSIQINDVVAAQLNDILDESGDNVTANTLQVSQYENDDKLAWDIIKALVSQGDAADNRYLFGVYAGRTVFYEAAPTTFEYEAKLGDPEQRVQSTLDGNRVYPWNVLPGKWLLATDLLVGTTEPSDLRLDPRAIFIESAEFSAPWSLTLQGGDSDKISQKLAKLGLSGIGA